MNRREFFLSGALAIGSVATRPQLAFGVQAEIGLGGSIDEALQLNWNENPLGMSPAATDAAIEAVSRGNRYPDALRQQLIAALAERHEVGAESIVLGNGSTEILQVVVQANAEREPVLVLADPTFGAILRYQRPFPYRVVRVPLGEAYSHDLVAMRSQLVRARHWSICATQTTRRRPLPQAKS